MPNAKVRWAGCEGVLVVSLAVGSSMAVKAGAVPTGDAGLGRAGYKRIYNDGFGEPFKNSFREPLHFGHLHQEGSLLISGKKESAEGILRIIPRPLQWEQGLILLACHPADA